MNFWLVLSFGFCYLFFVNCIDKAQWRH